MSVPALEEAIARDRSAGRLPMAVVATAGTTSTTSIDPIEAIADLCAREGIWLHVDAAYAGSAAICPEYRALMPGIERADSIVVNPHKWLFTPVDCSILWVKDPALLRAAFSLIPDYLRTDEPGVTNLMDSGLPARPPLPRAQALDGHPRLRGGGPARAHPRALRHRPRAGGADRGRSRLRAGCAGPLQHRLLPRPAARDRTASTSGFWPG